MMKIFSVIVLSALSTVAISCSEDYYVPNSAVKATFKAMFPKAVFVDWEQEMGFAKAEFRADGKEKDAWFEMSGNWLMTETDLRSKDIPAAVKTAINQTKYSTWRIDDVDYLEYADSKTMYVIDLEKAEAEVELHFSADGTLIKEKTEDRRAYHLP